MVSYDLLTFFERELQWYPRIAYFLINTPVHRPRGRLLFPSASLKAEDVFADGVEQRTVLPDTATEESGYAAEASVTQVSTEISQSPDSNDPSGSEIGNDG